MEGWQIASSVTSFWFTTRSIVERDGSCLVFAHRSIANMRRITNGSEKVFGRSAFTLMELMVVMSVLGVIAVAASSMLGSASVVSSLAAKQESQHMVAAMRAARATAIANGSKVLVQCVAEGRDIVGFQLIDGATGVLQPVHRFGEHVQSQWSDKEIVFLPTGMADKSLKISFEAESSAWVATVLSASGQVDLVRVK